MAKHFRRGARERSPRRSWPRRGAAWLLSLPDPVLAVLAGRAGRVFPDRSADSENPPRELEPALRLLCRYASLRGRLHDLEPPLARERLRGLGSLIPEVETLMDRTEERTIPGPGGELTLRIYTPADLREAPPSLVYFHGGGWVLGDLDGADGWCRMIAGQCPCKVFSVAYRLAPEHPFPAAVEDAVAAFRWVRSQATSFGLDHRRIAIGGESAGGNLAAVVSASLAAEPDARPFAQMLVYPVTSARRDTASYELFARGFGLERATMDYFFEHYLDDPVRSAEDPRVSPLLAEDLSGLPPTILATAGYDVLRDEGRAYAARLEAAGVPVVALHFPALMHSFAQMSGLPPVRRALDRLIGELAVLFHRAE